MDMEVRLDPIRQEWCILTPVDCKMRKVRVNEASAYTRFETGSGKNKVVFALAYSNPYGDSGTVNVCYPGVLNIHWSKGKKGSGEIESIHWTINVSSYDIASDIARQFLLALPEYLEPENGDW